MQGIGYGSREIPLLDISPTAPFQIVSAGFTPTYLPLLLRLEMKHVKKGRG